MCITQHSVGVASKSTSLKAEKKAPLCFYLMTHFRYIVSGVMN